jgi:hypothetical protein
MTTIAVPREHGAWLTLAGAGAAALLAGAEPAPAIGATLVLVAAFILRAAGDRVAMGRSLRRADLVTAGIVAGVGFGGMALSSSLAAAGIGLMIVTASALAKRARKQRDRLVELLALTGLGGAAGVIAFAGGVGSTEAIALAVALGAHAGASVPLVHVRLRGGSPDETRAAVRAAWVGVLAAAAILMALRPLAAVVLVPRALSTLRAGRARPVQVGAEEVLWLVAAVALAGWTS